MYRRAPIAFAVAASVALHVVLAVYWQPSHPPSAPPERSLNISLAPSAQPRPETQAEQPPASSTPVEPKPVTLAPPKPARPVNPATSRQEPAETIPRTAIVLTAKAVADAYQPERAPTAPCLPMERANIVHRCAHELAFAPEADLLENLFADETDKASFDDDMQRAQTLLAKAQGLAALDPNDPLQSALVAEQRAELRREVLRLDDQYRSVNLLRLLPMGWKAIKGVQQKLEESQ